MLTSITLKCSNCGANLDISPEMSTFACGYCGASQMVERAGGTVSLKLLTNAISNVQIGTDKTAAELAIRRLKEDLQELGTASSNLNFNERFHANKTQSNYKTIWIIVSVVFLLTAFAGGWVAVICISFWIIASGSVLYFYGQESSSNKIKFSQQRQHLSNKETEIRERTAQQRKIVDS